ncbi:coiled-coil domain-containing protein 88B [Spea bombifrons]|uniref:coiled-coil domain-containing protein 88B n=1 Tax=Spea bombifrons TaxID=233779 RepID=UPI00234B9891|nr:coiled-coil domain-containing protein 88B [Spea bombifrons]
MNFIDTRPYHGNLDLHGLKMRLQSYYQEELQQLILMPLPDTTIISQDPFSDISMQEMEKLLSLMLGAAVQCENREQIITRIQTLSLESQTMLAEKIKEMTQDSQKILSFPGPDLSYLSHSDLQKVVHILSTHLKEILRQRDETHERLSFLCCDQQTVLTPHIDPKAQRLSKNLVSEPQAWKNYTQRIAELQSKLQHLRQELEEKGEELLDSEQQMQQMEAEKRKLHLQVVELSSMAAFACGYRDELDALREHSRHYEAQITSLTEKLRNMDFYRRSLQEEKDFSKHLMEDKEVLEQQLATERERSERLRLCEREKMSLEEKLQRVEMERDSESQRVQLLLHDNLSLAEEIRVIRAETTLRWKTMYESDSKSDGETEHGWERHQGNDTEILDLNSELSEALLRLERENQNLKERLHTLKGENLDSETSAQHAQSKKYIQSLNQESDGGSLGEKEHLQKEWEIKLYERLESEQLTKIQYKTDVNVQSSQEQLEQNFESDELQSGPTEEMYSEEKIQKSENRDDETPEELHDATTSTSIEQSMGRLVENSSVHLKQVGQLEENYNEMQVLNKVVEERSIRQYLENRNTDDSEPVQRQLERRERDRLQMELDEKNKEVQVQNRKLEVKAGEIQMLKKQLVEKEDEKQLQQRLLQESITLTEYLQTRLLQSEESHLLNKHLQESAEEVQALKKHLEESIQDMKYLTRQLHDCKFQSLRKQLEESAMEMQSQKRHLEDSIGDNQLLKGQLEEKGLLEQSLKIQLKEITADIQVIKIQLQNSTTKEQSIRKQLEETAREKYSCEKLLEVCSQEVEFLKKNLHEREGQIQSLKRELQEITEEAKYLKKQMGVIHDIYLLQFKQITEESGASELVSLRRQLHKTVEEEKCLVKNIFEGMEERNYQRQVEGKEEEILPKTELQDRAQEIISQKGHLDTDKRAMSLKKNVVNNNLELQSLRKYLVEKAENIQCQKKQVKQNDKEREKQGWKFEASSEETQDIKAMLEEREVHEHVLKGQVHEMGEDVHSLERQLKENEKICVTSQLHEGTKETNAQQRQVFDTEEACLLKRQLAQSAGETVSLKRHQQLFDRADKTDLQNKHLEESTYMTQSLSKELQLQTQLPGGTDETKVLQKELHNHCEADLLKWQLQSSPEHAQCAASGVQMNLEVAEFPDIQSQDTEIDQQNYRRLLEETKQNIELQEIQLKQCTVKEKSLVYKLIDKEKSELSHTRKLEEATEALEMYKNILKVESPSRYIQQHHQKGLFKKKTHFLPQKEQFQKAQIYSQMQVEKRKEEPPKIHFEEGTGQLLSHPLLNSNNSELSNISINPVQKSITEPLLTVSVPFVSITTTNVPSLQVSTHVSSILPSPVSLSSPTPVSTILSISVDNTLPKSTNLPPFSSLSLPTSTSGLHSLFHPDSSVPQTSNQFPTPIYIHESTLSLLLLEVQEVRKERAEIQERYESLLRQEVELVNAQRERRTGRSALRVLRQEHQELQQRFAELSVNQEQIQQQQQMKLQEQECNMQKLQMENQKLHEEQKRLQDEISTLEITIGDKVAELREARRQLTLEQREKEQLERECREMKETVQRLEISNTALSDHYQVLSQVKLSLQDQNNLMLSQIHTLSRDNRELLERSLESGELRQEEERRYREKLTELKNEKQKLLDKIMDQYRVLEPASTIPSHHNRKGNWIADKMKRLLRSRERTPKILNELPCLLSPPNEPPAEAETTVKSTVVLRRSKSSVSSPSLPAHATNTSSRHAKLSSIIRSSESFGEADSTPRERFRLRRRGHILEINKDEPAGMN